MRNREESDAAASDSLDPIPLIIEEHKRNAGYYRMQPNRRVLIPHKISFGDVFGDQSHLTINAPAQPNIRVTDQINDMQLSDLNQNRNRLRDVESIELLSSLIIRAVQVHRKHLPIVPGLNPIDSLSTFTDVLSVSQAPIHSTPFQFPSRFPPIIRARPSSAEGTRIRADARARAVRLGLFSTPFYHRSFQMISISILRSRRS